MRVLGLDVGGTKCAVLLADAGEKIEIIRKIRFETHTELGFEYARHRLLAAAEELAMNIRFKEYRADRKSILRIRGIK